MGGSASRLCDGSSGGRREVQVLVMKEDGEFLKLKENKRVKDILVANAYHDHKVIRCCSDRSVLPDSFQLSCNNLYFLLPRDALPLSDQTYEGLLKLAASRYSKFLALKSRSDINNDDGDGDGDSLRNRESNNKILCTKDDPVGNQSSRWKPALKTIPEINSPAPVKIQV